MLYYFLILLLFFTCLQMCWAQIPPTEIYAPLLDQIDESQIQQWNDNEEWDTNLSIESDQKININQCVESDLYLFPFLSPQDINNILNYRKQFGPFKDLYELQVIPNLKLSKAISLAPYLTLEEKKSSRWNPTESKGYIVAQTSFQWPKREEFRSIENQPPKYLGSPMNFLLKYRKYSYHQGSMGFSIEKDAGEPWLNHRGTYFDNLHFHFYRELQHPWIKSYVIGDYLISWGQGLLHYQGFGLSKSSNAMMIKRSSQILKPYTGRGEFNFLRGAALQIQPHQHWNLTFHLHMDAKDAKIYTDSISSHYSSIQSSGYHRTQTELDNENTLMEYSAGLRTEYHNQNVKLGYNQLAYRYSIPLKPISRVYNLNYSQGHVFHFQSMDYSFHFNHWSMFGEIATENVKQWAGILGFITSFHKKLDFSLLLRNFSPNYRPRQANPFSAQSNPTNEKGIYIGFHYYQNPFNNWQTYIDHWYSRWPSFTVDSPATHTDFLLQYHYHQKKRSQFISTLKVRCRSKEAKQVAHNHQTIVQSYQINLRMQWQYDASKIWTWTTRLEQIRYQFHDQLDYGWLLSQEVKYGPLDSPWKITGKFTYHQTDSYQSRIYSYEPDLAFNFRFPAYHDHGCQLTLKSNLPIHNAWKISLRYGLNIKFSDSQNSLDNGSRRNTMQHDLRMQLLYQFKPSSL